MYGRGQCLMFLAVKPDVADNGVSSAWPLQHV